MRPSERARLQIEARIYRDAIGAPPVAKWKLLGALLCEPGFAARIIRKRLNLPTPLDTTDRIDLERRILPHYCANRKIRNVLFVGCNTYTAHYQRRFFRHVNYVTIEPNPALRRFGARDHIEAPLERLDEHCSAGAFDLIICNGVLGWGLDSFEQCEQAFSQCHRGLRENGDLLLGWDDLPQRTPARPENIPSLKRFRRHEFPEFGTWRYLTNTPFRHTYDFYRK